MQTIGVLLLAAATAGDGLGYSKPGVHFKKLLRPHVVASSPTPPPGGPQFTAATMGAGGAMGAPGAGAASGRRFVNTRSQIYFLDPDGMNISWQVGATPTGERTYVDSQLVVPARYNFNQGYIYRLRLTSIPGRPNIALYPTIEVAPTTPATDAYLAHNAIPVQFTAEDFDQVIDGGNFVTKVIYLPDPKYQEVAVSGVETLISTRLEPGVDPIIEADKRGTILLIVRLGAIDLEMPTANIGGVPNGPNVGSPFSDSFEGSVGSPVVAPPVTELPPGSLPPGVTAPPAEEAVPLDLDEPVIESAPAPNEAPAPPSIDLDVDDAPAPNGPEF